jgi:nitroreductase
MGDILDLIRARRSVRRYKPDPVSEDLVQKVLEAGRWAPSGANTQPWEFIVVQDVSLRAAMAQLLIEDRERLKGYDPNFPGTGVNYLKDVPVMIVVCADPRFINFYPLGARREVIFYFSIAAAIENMFLAAWALGLGTAWLTIRDGSEEALRQLLGIPRGLEVHAVMPIGYPAVAEKDSYRRELTQMVHRDRYDPSKRVPDEVLERALSSKENRLLYRRKGAAAFS